MDEILYETMKNEFGLKANQVIFADAWSYSQFFREQLHIVIRQYDEQQYLQDIVSQWLSRFDEPLQECWLRAQVRSVFLPCTNGDVDAVGVELDQAMAKIRLLRNIMQVRSIYCECAIGEMKPMSIKDGEMHECGDAIPSPLWQQALIEQMAQYSLFADLVLEQSEVYLRNRLMRTWQVEGQAPPLIIVGLGKLGARELNLSSDIDLIFCYDAQFELVCAKDREASEFYTTLGQKLIKFLNDITPEGFVFRVDMRLRPFGQSGALVWSTQAIEIYYEQQGRMWERFAWIKARAIVGAEAARCLLHNLKPFIYRRYLDFAVIDALREMKFLIAKEVSSRSGDQNIKLGRGGIREVEFIVQVIQLVRGGDLTELQNPSLMQTLTQIEQLNILPVKTLNELRADYLFLRRIEHFLQASFDRQTQTMPSTHEELQDLALLLRYDSLAMFKGALQEAQNRIHHHFEATIQAPKAPHKVLEGVSYWASLWPNNIESLTDGRIKEILLAFQSSRCIDKASDIAQERLNNLMPVLLAIMQVVTQDAMPKESTMSHQFSLYLPELDLNWGDQADTLERILRIIESILRRPAYLSLLLENQEALYNVMKLCATSLLMQEKLAHYPSLLNEFVGDMPVNQIPSRESLIDELRQQLVRIPEDDFEQQMARLRSFKQRHTLRAAVADIAGQLPLMNVSDYLTWLAQALLQAAFDIAWRKLTLRYGEPARYANSRTGFLIVGYGKLGGIELSYTSDLDIVFLYDVPENGETQGPKVIENSVFYLQLVKNLNHILMTDTMSGRLYEIDMRLRPSGSAGLFVSTFEGFQRYQEQEAWIWERQALVRARPVVGDPHLFDRFAQLRIASLGAIAPTADLAQKVLNMREKMKSHLISQDGRFDLKYGAGGIVDIEFLAQHLVLHFGSSNPAMLKFSDNVRIFEAAHHDGVLSQAESEILIQAYLLYRAIIHRLSLQKKEILISDILLVETRRQVVAISDRWFEQAKRNME